MNENDWLLGIIAVLNLGLILVLFPVHLYRFHILLKKLKETETQEWKRLGSPKSVITPRDNTPIAEWLLRKEYLRLGNQEIIKEARLGRILLIAGMVSVFTMCILILYANW